MIEHAKHVQTLRAPGLPTLVTCTRAALPCGCAVYVGLFAHNGEAGTGVTPCSPGHEHLARHVHMLIQSSLVEPQDRLFVEVAEELLEQAARAHGIPVA